MIRCWFLALALFLLTVPVCAAEVTQRDWMVQLSDSLGWSFGLPDEPQDEDYIALLSGERSLRLEAEAVDQPTDLVAVKRFTNYGDYSGKGWVSGLRKTTQLKLPFLLRHSGRYRLAATTRLPGVRLQLYGKEYVLEGGPLFARQDLGEINLPAGQMEFIVDLPPQSGLDFIELLAPPRTAIRPINGWQPQQALSAEVLALTTLQALDLLKFLPETAARQTVEVEAISRQTAVPKTRDRHLGAPSGGVWLRAGNQAGKMTLPLRVSQAGCYRLVIRGSSEQPVSFDLPGRFSEKLNFGKSLTRKAVDPFCLAEKQLELQVILPAWAGLDRLELTRLDSGQKQLLRLLGLPKEQTQVTVELMNEVLSLLTRLSL